MLTNEQLFDIIITHWFLDVLCHIYVDSDQIYQINHIKNRVSNQRQETIFGICSVWKTYGKHGEKFRQNVFPKIVLVLVYQIDYPLPKCFIYHVKLWLIFDSFDLWLNISFISMRKFSCSSWWMIWTFLNGTVCESISVNTQYRYIQRVIRKCPCR